MQYKISYWCVSHIGNIRKMNQDNFICDGHFMEVNDENIKFPLSGVRVSKDGSLFGIFDGMGGEECGEIASYIAAKDAADLQIGKDAIAVLSQFCQKANTDICDYANANGVFSMGTTAAMLAFTRNGITLCNLGDSKIFRFFDGILEQISEDHVMASVYGMKPPLLQNLGIPPTELLIAPYLAQRAYKDNEIYLICSDGLTDMVTTEEIVEVLNSKAIDEVSKELLDRALSSGGRDNISMILCKIQREPVWPFRWKRSIHKKRG